MPSHLPNIAWCCQLRVAGTQPPPCLTHDSAVCPWPPACLMCWESGSRQAAARTALAQKRNHKQKDYGMGENTCKWCDRRGINFQNTQTAHTAWCQCLFHVSDSWNHIECGFSDWPLSLSHRLLMFLQVFPWLVISLLFITE